MTGTAATEAEEFYKIYGLETIIIPTNKKMVRKDHNDCIYKNEHGKFTAVVAQVKELYQKGQPVLLGTISIEKSEVLSQLLKMEGVPHKVLNAKQHEKEAEIVAKAGEKGTITIATNMAGRGTDIRLGEEVVSLGGLFVLGTERHESRRIDNQLRGRSGRQGDPGASQFFVSMEDDLMRMFGSDRIKKTMDFLKVPEDMPIENNLISKSIEGAQKKVEGHNFDIRKHLVEYDDVMNRHRDIIYSRRRKILVSTNIKNDIMLLIEKESENIVLKHTEGKEPENWDYQEISENIKALILNENQSLSLEELQKIDNQEGLIEKVKNQLWTNYENTEKQVPDPSMLRQLERNIYLHVIDTLWMGHIDEMSHLREAVSLQGYGQRDPLINYKTQAYENFALLIGSIQHNTISTLLKIRVNVEVPANRYQETQPKRIQTNEDQIKEIESGDRQLLADQPKTVKAAQKPIISHKVGRNEPCPCGAKKPDGTPKKYKQCCGK